MKIKVLISSIILLHVVHVALLIFTDYSLVGYLPDVIFPLLLFGVLLLIIKRNKVGARVKKGLVRYSVFMAITFIFLGVNSIVNKGLFSAFNTFKVVGFHYYQINNEYYHGYFEPVGAYSGGEGNMWITQSPSIFPFIERRVYDEHAVLWDFSIANFDGEDVDQRKVMRATILEYLKSE